MHDVRLPAMEAARCKPRATPPGHPPFARRTSARTSSAAPAHGIKRLRPSSARQSRRCGERLGPRANLGRRVRPDRADEAAIDQGMHGTTPFSNVTEFVTEVRHHCRNPKCRSKHKTPVANPREAFRARRSCHMMPPDRAASLHCRDRSRAPRCPVRRSQLVLLKPPRAVRHLDGARQNSGGLFSA